MTDTISRLDVKAVKSNSMETLASLALLQESPLGLYVHIPFCERKCPYCDFNTYAGLESQFDDLIDALCLEMERWQEPLSSRHISTIFIGGGTPTVLSVDALTKLFDALFTHFNVKPDAEISCEANPGTVDRRKFTALKSLGVNRLSMGVQSFQAEELDFLGRIHTVDDVFTAWAMARKAGFDNINLDFIFGLPEQHPATWRDTIHTALELKPDHLSLYSLIVEENTPLHHWVETGQTAMPDDDIAATQYEAAAEMLSVAGYHHYEVSNWARTPDRSGDGTPIPERACRHNLIYWRNQEYVGIGPGAHSHLRFASSDGMKDNRIENGHASIEKRWGNHRPVAGYIKRMRDGQSVEAFDEVITPRLSMGETMMLGLRLLQEGVSERAFQQKYGMEIDAVYGETLAHLADQDLVTRENGRVCLTSQGMMLGNQIFMQFLPDA